MTLPRESDSDADLRRLRTAYRALGDETRLRIIGLLAGWGLEYWTQVIAFPENIGGRPYNSWVSFIPPAFETTILFASATAVFAMFALNGLPQPYHPVFNAPRFKLASQDRFFLAIEATDPKFNADETRAFLTSLEPREVVQVEN
jgi:hypothetical protein